MRYRETLMLELVEAVRCHREGDVEMAERAYRKMLRQAPNFAEANHFHGLLRYQQGDAEQGLQRVRRAVRLKPDYADAWNDLGNMLIEQNRWKEAIDAIAKVVELRPSDAGAMSNLGVALRRMGKRDEAVAQFQRALELQPDRIEPLLNLAAIERECGRLEESRNFCERALAIAPDHTEALARLGSVHKAERRYKEARDCFEKCVALDPHSASLWFELGYVRERLGDRESAAAAFRETLKRDVKHSEAYENLGVLYRALGRSDEAAATWRAWLEVEPNNPTARHLAAAVAPADEAPKRASDAYVEATFDWFARTFDEKLRLLDYRAPALVEGALTRLLKDRAEPRLSILDAGCGTGLCAEFLKRWAGRLEGVDLSAGMLEQARRRGLYDALIKAELTEYLSGHIEEYDVIVSVDTLVYFGVLSEVLPAMRRALRSGGFLVFTVEATAEAKTSARGFKLTDSGRYAHEKAYVAQCLGSAGFEQSKMERVILRKEAGVEVEGYLVTASVVS